jgi:hypothetical protein
MLHPRFLSIILPMILASAGCIGTETEPYSGEDEAMRSDDPIAVSGDEPIGSSTDYLPAPVDDSGLVEGGGSMTPPPPPAPPDTSESYLNAAARGYLTQAGVTDASAVGATKWVNACRVNAQQGSVTFNSGVTRVCSWANIHPGWIIVETAYDVLYNKNKRGSASVSSTNGPVTISTVEFGSKFDLAISLAQSLGDASAALALQLEYQRLNGYSFYFGGAGNQLVATVTANGGLVQSANIDIQARAKLLRIY